MKKVFKIFIIPLFSLLFGTVSCSLNKADTGTLTHIKEFQNKACYYCDNKNEEVYKLYGNGEELTSIPYFASGSWIIDKKNTTKTNIPSFFIAGDEINFYVYYEGRLFDDGVIFTPGNERSGGTLVFSDESEFEYKRTSVRQIDESIISRDEEGKILSIENLYYNTNDYKSLSHITIDKEYHFIDINEYKGEKIYASYYIDKDIIARFYSFNPLTD